MTTTKSEHVWKCEFWKNLGSILLPSPFKFLWKESKESKNVFASKRNTTRVFYQEGIQDSKRNKCRLQWNCDINCMHFKSYYTIYYGMPIHRFFLSFAPSLISLLLLPRFYVITFRPCLTFSFFTTQHFEPDPTYPFISDQKLSTEIRARHNISANRTIGNFSWLKCWMVKENFEKSSRKKELDGK